MKKIALFVISIVSLAIVSCNESIIDVDDIKDVIGNDNTTFTVSMPETKTTLDGTFVKWAAGDKIRVYGYTEGQAVVSKDYTLKSGEGTRSAIFENTSDPIGDYDQYFAIYPALDKFNLNTSSLPSKLEIGSSFTLTGQAAVENGFDPDFALMLAQADANKKLVFKYGMGFIKITIPVDNVTEVSISSDKSWTCRRPEYNADGSFSKANSGTSEVSSVGSFIKDSSYYLLAPARGTNFGNITVKYTIGGSNNEFSGSVSASIVNGEIFDLGTPWAERIPELNLLKSSVANIPASGGTGLTIENAYSLKYCNDSDLTVTTDGSIVTSASVSGGTITYSIDANTDTDSRAGYIYLKLGSNDAETITVNQLGTASTATKESHEWNFASFTDAQMHDITGLDADAKASAGLTWNFGDGLTMVTNSSSKWNNQTINEVDYKWVATGGKYGSNQKYFSFTTEHTGTVTVLYASGGSGNRALTLNVNGTESIDSTNVSTGTSDLKTVTFASADAGTLMLYSKDDNVRIFSISFLED